MYRFTGGSWGSAQTLTSTAGAGAQFGTSVSISADGNIAIVGAPDASTSDGYAAVYRFTGGSWGSAQPLTSTAGATAYFGTSVSISVDGNTAIVGGSNGNGGNGYAAVYWFTGGSWGSAQTLTSTAGAGAQFGTSVFISADGNTAFVGAPYAPPGYAGYAAVFLIGQKFLINNTFSVYNGFVGIGTKTPTANLHVIGNVYASNSVTTTNVYASNSVTTTNVFVSNINFASTSLGPTVAGQLQYNTYLYGTINTTSGRGSVPTDYIYRLTGTVLSSATTILNFFTGTATGAGSLINLEASSVYNIEALCYFTKTNAGTIIWSLNASSAPSHVSARYIASPVAGIAASPGTTNAAAVLAYVWSQGQASTAFAVTGILTGTPVNHSFLFKIQVVTNAATNFGIFATQSALSLTALAGSYYRVTKISTTTGAFA